MSKPPPSDPFASSFGGAGFSEDPFKSKQDTPALPPKKPAPPRPHPPSEEMAEQKNTALYSLLGGHSTPVSQLGHSRPS
nr:epidermal growth factor receptor substrate 15-like 1 [Loxodonta africana]